MNGQTRSSPVGGTVFNIQRYSTQDGPGIRTTVFFKGCPLDCRWCHNPEGKAPAPALAFRAERCIRCGACDLACPLESGQTCTSCGTCAKACPTEARSVCGVTMTVHELMSEIIRDRICFDQSGGGATFSGGEPTAQPRFLMALLAQCRREGVSTSVDTCGHAEKSVLLEMAKACDLVLYDLKGHGEARHISNTGVGSARILENLEALVGAGCRIWLRLPIVAGHTDDADEMELLARVCRGMGALGRVERVDLLPYHPLGVGKLEWLGVQQKMPTPKTPTPQELDMLAGIWKNHRFDVHIGAWR